MDSKKRESKRDHDKCVEVEVRTRDVDYNLKNIPIKLPLSTCYTEKQLTWYEDVIISYRGAVEPSIAVNPKDRRKIVVVWQLARINNSGALDIGIAHSEDHGKTWRNSIVPFQFCIGGIIQRSSDPWLSYSPCGKFVFLSVLVFNVIPWPNLQENIQYGVVVTKSCDNGKTWSDPVYVITTPDTITSPPGLPFDDKNTITCDPYDCCNIYQTWNRTPAFLPISFQHSDAWFTRSNDGGKTWFPAVLIYNPTRDLFKSGLSNNIEANNSIFNNQVIVLPPRDKCNPKDPRRTGELLNFMVRTYAIPSVTDSLVDQAAFQDDSFPFQLRNHDIAVIRSDDQGVGWTQRATVVSEFSINNRVFTNGYTYSPYLYNFVQLPNPPVPNVNINHITGGVGDLLRTGDNAPSYAINKKNGNLYVVFQDSRGRSDSLVQIFLTASRDGGHTWSAPVQVNKTPQCVVNPQAFTGTVAVTDKGLVGILYNDFRNDEILNEKTLTDAWFVVYKEIDGESVKFEGSGLKFITEVRLSKKSYIAENGPVTTGGIMTNGDYSGLVADHEEFYAAYTKSFNGPFVPNQILRGPEIIPPGNTPVTLFLNPNLLTSPFVSVIRVKLDDCCDDKSDDKADDKSNDKSDDHSDKSCDKSDNH